MKINVGALLAFIFLISCQKEIDFDTPALVDQACKACSYVPFCNGTVYVYSDTTMGGIGSDVIETITIVKDTTIDNKVFQKFSNPGVEGYYNCSAGVSTVLAFNTLAPGIIARAEHTLLKANQPVGATWSNSLPFGLNVADYAYSIQAKGLTRTVLGITYNDVIQVHMIISSIFPGGGTLVAGEYDYFYANNIGLIEQIDYASIGGGPLTVIHHRVLKSYDIP